MEYFFRKGMVFIIIGLFLGIGLSPVTSENNVDQDYRYNDNGESTNSDDIEISISAGRRGKDIGFGFIVIDVLNNKKEEVICYVNISYNFWNPFNDDSNLIFNFEYNFTIQPEDNKSEHNGLIGGVKKISFFTIKVEVEDVIIQRKGISIYRLIVFY